MTDLELRAHDLAVVLSQQNTSENRVSCDPGSVFEFVKAYEHFYKYVLNSFESIE